MVRMRARATDPRIVPAALTTANSFLLTFHLVNNPKSRESPKMETRRAMTQTRVSRQMKTMEKTSLVR
jgi:hypothetical protein